MLASFSCTPNEISIGWLSFTFPRSLVVDILPFLDSYLLSTVEPAGRTRWYGLQLMADGYSISTDTEDMPEPRPEALCSISATALARICESNLPNFLWVLANKFQASVTRIDLTYDNHAQTFTVRDLAELHHNKGVISGVRGFRVGHFISSESDTLYLGRRGKNGGGKFARIYDEHGFPRIEIEYSDIKAKQIFSGLIEGFIGPDATHTLSTAFKSSAGERKALIERVKWFLFGSLDFYTPDTWDETNIPRRKLQNWWSDIKEMPSRVKWIPRKRDSVHSLSKKEHWFQRQYAPFLYAESLIRGNKFIPWLRDLLQDGKDRMNVVLENIVENFKDGRLQDSESSLYKEFVNNSLFSPQT